MNVSVYFHRIWCLWVLVWPGTYGWSQQSLIANAIADYYSLRCVYIMHHKNLDDQMKVSVWLKDLSLLQWRTVGIDQLVQHTVPLPSGLRCLHVIFANLSTKAQFIEMTHRSQLHLNFWLIFLEAPAQIIDWFKDAALPISLDLNLVTLHGDDNANLYEVYRVSDKHPTRIILAGHWTKRGGLKVTTKGIFHQRSNLEGVQLNVGITENWPICYKVKDEDGTVHWDGYFLKVWQIMEELNNVTTSFHTDVITGSKQANGSWSGLIGMAERGEVDIIVSKLTISASRLGVLDFTHSLLKSRYQIFFKQPGVLLDWMSALRPFPETLWWAILLWIFGATIFNTICFYLSCRTGMETKPFPKYGFLNFFYYILQALSQQGRDDVPRSSACRILFFSSYLVSAVVIPAYSASLISSLTQKTPVRPFDTISEMLEENEFKLLVVKNTAEADYFKDATGNKLEQVQHKLIETVPPQHQMTSLDQGLQTICNHEYALFGVDAIVARRAEYLRIPHCNVLTLAEHLSIVNIGFALPKNHPYRPLVNYRLWLMIERGIIVRTWSASWPRADETKPTAWSEVELEEVFHIFAFLAVAIIFSWFILCIEIVVYRKTHFTDVETFIHEFIN